MTDLNANPPATSQLDVLLAIARLEGKLDGALMQQARHETTLQTHQTELTALRDKVTALETQRKAAAPWTASVPALVAVLTIVLLLARDLYGGR